MDRPAVRQVPEDNGEQGKWRKLVVKSSVDAPATLVVTEWVKVILRQCQTVDLGLKRRPWKGVISFTPLQRQGPEIQGESR